MKILIAEQHPSHRKLLRVVLEVEGYGVIEAPDGAQALLMLEREPVDAIIADILMPKLDGFRLCHEIRRSERWGELPFIFYPASYSNHDSSIDEQLALKLGGDIFLRRPAPASAIVAALQLALKRTGRAASALPLTAGTGVFREYSERLVARLEAKNLELAQVNQELAESRARFEGIISSAVDAIIMVDDAERIVLFNPAAEEMFCCSAAVVHEQPLKLLLPERLHGDCGTHLRALGAAGASCRRKNGTNALEEEFPVEASISQLEAGGRNLSTLILRDISLRQQMEGKLKSAKERYRALAARLEAIREEERTSIARDIHDVLAQDLTRLKIDLVWLAKRLAGPVRKPLRLALAERITNATDQTNAAIIHVQRIATQLRPAILDSLGLSAAVEWQVEDFARRTGLACRANAPRGETPLDSVRATALFRILQESLTNVARHANATAVDVQLTENAGAVTLMVHDNGRGITPEEIDNPHSIGLIGMSERAQAFGGAVQIAGDAHEGTTVTVRISSNGSVPPFLP
jgi:PAS domain S-box-containing protein